ncbi:MAG: AP2/ERF family transcription factor [Sedimentisphaerales bacterium]
MFTQLTIRVPVCLDLIFAWPVLLYRKVKYGHPFRKIPLGEGRFTIVEPGDFYQLNRFNWCAKENGPRIYAVRLVGDSNNRTKIISMHREIMGEPAGMLVDHHNRNTLDNRKENLRLATHSQNQFNKGKTTKKTTSRFIGVFFEKQSGRWVARTTVGGKRIWLGRFDDETEAAKAYDEAAKKYHGEFAQLNFPNLTAENAENAE